jgi:hypothetical protein
MMFGMVIMGMVCMEWEGMVLTVGDIVVDMVVMGEFIYFLYCLLIHIMCVANFVCLCAHAVGCVSVSSDLLYQERGLMQNDAGREAVGGREIIKRSDTHAHHDGGRREKTNYHTSRDSSLVFEFDFMEQKELLSL